MAQERDKATPIVQFRRGNIEASIWRNEITKDGQIRLRHSTRIKKQYKKDGSYKTTSNYFPHELPQVILLLQRCYEYIILSSESREPDEAGSA